MTTTWACYYCTYEQEGSKSQCELCGMPGRRVLNTTITTTEATAVAAESTTTTIPNSNDGSICSSSSSSSSVDNKSIEKHRQKERFNLFTTATSSNSTTTTTSTSSRKRKISSNCDNGVMKRNSYTSSNNKTKKYERIDILDDSGSDIETDTDTNIKQQNRRRQSQQKQQHQQRQRQQQSTLSFSATNSKSNSISASNADLSHGHIFAHKVVSSSLSARATEYDNYDEEEATEYNNYDEEEVTEHNNYDEDEVQRVMERVFKLQSLRNLQPKAIKCAMEGKSQMIVMATGGGKSLCYQLPACLLGGVSIVISPLLALMKDQTEALNKKGIPAACINSSQTERQNKEILERLVPSLYPKSCNNSSSISTLQKQQPTVLLYITPESIQTERMRAVLKRLYKESRLAMFAVDEAHCLSTWGHDFRSSYRKLNYLRTTFPKTIIMALTATATPKVIQDITKELSLQNCPLHVGSFDRPNIFYKVKYKDALDNPLDDLVKYVVGRHIAHNNSKNGKKKYNREECSGIVYVHKREETSMIARAISKKGISASAYHGGLKKAERIAVQDGWSSGNIQVAVATVAFGMGIDRHCVRYVVHWCLPKSIEGFYQEAGRAGRDGLPSHSLLYYSPTDVGKFKYLIRMQSGSGKNKNNFDAAEKNAERKLEQLEEMQEYCTQMKCRRNTLICHFSGSAVECKSTCDVCKDPKKVERIMQASTAIKDVRRQHFIGGGRGGRGGKKGGGKQPWDGQWNKPHGHFGGGDDDEDAIANDWGDNCLMAGDLRVTGPLEVDPGDYSSGKTRTGFMKASDILSKYESMEGQATTRYGNDYDGFFGDTEQPSRSSTKNSINIPEHLKASLKAASDFTTANNIYQKEKKATKTLSSTDHAMKAKEIQEKLATIKAQREKKLKSLQGKNTNKPPPPPPAPLSFGRRKRN
mmetsp:Transcript_57732/g.64575  ORF Transcript_57732/g.64575 Transcript_57732/m.64575 type:complete len:927 (+) Transcript_57732:125-2905(+)